MVGLVRWSRNHPGIKENLSNGVGLVRGMKCRNFERMTRLCHAMIHRRYSTSTELKDKPPRLSNARLLHQSVSLELSGRNP
jgi:hypothetical protein